MSLNWRFIKKSNLTNFSSQQISKSKHFIELLIKSFELYVDFVIFNQSKIII